MKAKPMVMLLTMLAGWMNRQQYQLENLDGLK